MRNPQRRLEQLETLIWGVWPTEVEAAKRRVLARVRVKISIALDAMGDQAFTADEALLAGDTPEQVATDTKILQRWARQHPGTLYPEGSGTRDRIAASLGEVARRLEANHEP